MSQPEEQPQPYYKKSQQDSSSNKHIKRTKGHEAILKVKQVSDHIDMMRRRNKYLQVRDELNRSLTIQHERKLMMHDERRQQAQRQKDQLQRYFRRRQYQIQTTRDKNTTVRDQRQKKIDQMCEKYLNQKIQAYQTIKTERIKNEETKLKNKESDVKQKQQIRKSVNEMQQISRTNISRFRQNRYRDSVNYKENQFNSLMHLAANKEKQLEMLSKMEEEMVRKSSESMQASQVVRNRLRQVMGISGDLQNFPQLRMAARQEAEEVQAILKSYYYE